MPDHSFHCFHSTPCDVSAVSTAHPPLSAHTTCSLHILTHSLCVLQGGNGLNKWVDVGIQVAMIAIYRLCFWAMLVLKENMRP